MVVGYLVGLTLNFDIPLSAKFCLGRWKFGRIGWAAGQVGGTFKSKSTQPSNQPPSPPCTTLLVLPFLNDGRRKKAAGKKSTQPKARSNVARSTEASPSLVPLLTQPLSSFL